MMYQIRRVASYLVFVSLWMGLAPSLHAQRVDLASGTATTGDPVAIVWEVDGEIVCSHTPPESSLDAFVFSDGARWSATSADGFGLDRGDPMQLTWGIVPDGTPIDPAIFGESSDPSSLIAFLDSVFGAGSGGSDLTQRPWFDLFEQIFTRWSELTGIRYIYQAADDGAFVGSGSARGSSLRPDVRISGHSIDGQSGILGYNYFPENGDMVLDTADANNFGFSSNNFRLLRNTLSHEHGHGLGFQHVCTDDAFLMEPIISLSFDGPQEDDVLMANRGYGDTLEFPAENDTPGTAHSLGSLGGGDVADVIQVSIDGLTDVDFYAFTVPSGVAASVTLTPTGTSYLSGPQNANGTCSSGSSFDALRQSDLRLELYGLSGTNLLASADANGLGGSETLTDMMLTEGAGTYFVRVSGAHDKAQMYELSLSIGGGSCNSAENVFCDDFESRDLLNWSRVVGAASP